MITRKVETYRNYDHTKDGGNSQKPRSQERWKHTETIITRMVEHTKTMITRKMETYRNYDHKNGGNIWKLGSQECWKHIETRITRMLKTYRN